MNKNAAEIIHLTKLGWTSESIANEMNIKHATVRTIKTRAIKELREVCKEEDMEGVEDLTEKLNITWQEISTKMYESTEQDMTDDTTGNSEESATDVEYEEVK